MKAYRIAEIVNAIEEIKEQSMSHLADGSDSEKFAYYVDRIHEIFSQIKRLENSFCCLVDNLMERNRHG